MNQHPRDRDAGRTELGNTPLVVSALLLAVILGVGIVASLGGGGDDSEAARPVAGGSVIDASLLATTVPTTMPTTTVAPVDLTEEPTLPPIDRTLRQGVQGNDVQQLQERLAALGFDPGPVDGVFGAVTTQAVWAFEKLVLGIARQEATGSVSPETWERLRREVVINPRRSTNGQANHTEVYLPEQVLVVFHRDRPALITHISSGELDENGDPEEYCETATYDTDARGRELEEPVTKQVCALSKTPGGVFTYDRQVEGKRVSPLGGMWNPVYFNYGIAVHGADEVPNEPASHGCVRLPMHISEYFQSVVDIGERILVWNGEDEPENVSERESLPSFDYEDPNATTTTTSTTSTTTTSTTVPPATAPVMPSVPATEPPASAAPTTDEPADTTAPTTTIVP